MTYTQTQTHAMSLMMHSCPRRAGARVFGEDSLISRCRRKGMEEEGCATKAGQKTRSSLVRSACGWLGSTRLGSL